MYAALTHKKQHLDRHRPLAPEIIDNLGRWLRVELTYTSNAIEGNTLTRQETALVLEKGLTVGGKTLVEHLEATNHARALDWIYTQVTRQPSTLSSQDILYLHTMILKGIQDPHAGCYRNVPVRISGSMVIFPNPRKVPDLMAEFVAWLTHSKDLHPVALAAEAHYKLVTIHPFIDGNGRTARLLMNLILLMSGYPPAIIHTADRLHYLNTLEKAQLGGSTEDFFTFIARAVDQSLDIYLDAVANSIDEDKKTP
jgi:Fic family protein